MRYEKINPDLFIENRENLYKLLKPNSIIIIHSNDVMPTNADGVMPFKQNSDLFYLSGIDQEETILVAFPDAQNASMRELLFVRETNEHIAIWEGHKLSKEETSALSGINQVHWTSQFETITHGLIQQADHVYLSTNEHLRADTSVETRNARYIKKFITNYPLQQVERLSPLLHQLRPIKHQVEIDQIQTACDITEKGFRRVLDMVKPGIGEWEIEAEFIHEFTKRKSNGFAYTPIIASGSSNNVLHYTENDKLCNAGELILMDVGAEYANWNADMTRTIPVSGKFTERQREVYDATLRVLRFANTILRPGKTISKYQEEVVLYMAKELITLGLIDAVSDNKLMKSNVRKYFMHGASHHLGLDVHDVSPTNSEIEIGNVFTIEPGIYIPEEKFGIRLENNFNFISSEFAFSSGAYIASI